MFRATAKTLFRPSELQLITAMHTRCTVNEDGVEVVTSRMPKEFLIPHADATCPVGNPSADQVREGTMAALLDSNPQLFDPPWRRVVESFNAQYAISTRRFGREVCLSVYLEADPN